MIPDPLSPYAVSKLAAEYYIRTIGTLWGIETVSLRIFNAYGPGQELPASYPPVIPQLLKQAQTGGSLVIFVAQHLPAWVNSDHLTLLGFIAILVLGLICLAGKPGPLTVEAEVMKISQESFFTEFCFQVNGHQKGQVRSGLKRG